MFNNNIEILLEVIQTQIQINISSIFLPYGNGKELNVTIKGKLYSTEIFIYF